MRCHGIASSRTLKPEPRIARSIPTNQWYSDVDRASRLLADGIAELFPFPYLTDISLRHDPEKAFYYVPSAFAFEPQTLGLLRATATVRAALY